jgi:SAM-dependent methyltransferase
MASHDAEVARYYDGPIFEAERSRLETEFPVEGGITLRYLARWVPAGARVAEIGVGGGVYTRALIARGARVHLVDVSRRLLDAVVADLSLVVTASRTPADAILGATHASATDLSALPDGAFDVVLLLGPLYHLLTAADRRRAVEEAARLLRADGVVMAAGINRLAYLRELFHDSPAEVLARRAFHERYLREGNLDPTHAPPIGYAHLTTVAELRALFDGLFREEVLAGLESFAAARQRLLRDRPAEEREAWLDLIEQTGLTPEGLAQADHWLFIGRRLVSGDR